MFWKVHKWYCLYQMLVTFKCFKQAILFLICIDMLKNNYIWGWLSNPTVSWIHLTCYKSHRRKEIHKFCAYLFHPKKQCRFVNLHEDYVCKSIMIGSMWHTLLTYNIQKVAISCQRHLSRSTKTHHLPKRPVRLLLYTGNTGKTPPLDFNYTYNYVQRWSQLFERRGAIK